MNKKTYHPTQKEVKRSWHLVNAKDQILGRMSTNIATLLMGKQKASYSPHMDSGDYVVVINAEKVELTGRKKAQKLYRGHSGYPGGFKEITFEKMSKEHPDRVISFAVKGMLPDNRLKKTRLSRLKIIVGENNPYTDKIKENG